MGSTGNGFTGDRAATISGGTVVDKDVDFANYFCTYGFLYHQKEMLCDRVRMDSYYNAVFDNKHHFDGKTVLDVGTGSGILAIWAGQAGARKVYAVEATKMSEHARELVKSNNLQDIVEVIEGSIEDVTLPEKVDVIISEWMGYFLLRESMFDSVICARDRWLKPTGVMGNLGGTFEWFMWPFDRIDWSHHWNIFERNIELDNCGVKENRLQTKWWREDAFWCLWSPSAKPTGQKQ